MQRVRMVGRGLQNPPIQGFRLRQSSRLMVRDPLLQQKVYSRGTGTCRWFGGCLLFSEMQGPVASLLHGQALTSLFLMDQYSSLSQHPHSKNLESPNPIDLPEWEGQLQPA